MRKLFVVFLLWVGIVCADDTTSAIRIYLKAELPQLTVDKVSPTPISGLYEVVSGRKVFYVDSSGKYAILGNMVDLSTKKSLTEEAVKSLMVVNWSQLPIKLALRQNIGPGNRRIAVFTDPDCPFCKRFEAEIMPKLKDVVVYSFLYPLKIHEDGVTDSQKILCAQNPEATFKEWMMLGTRLPDVTKCKNALKLLKMQEVGANLVGVNATPTIILPNGQIIQGLIPADYLNQLITDTSGVAPQEIESKAIMESKAR